MKKKKMLISTPIVFLGIWLFTTYEGSKTSKKDLVASTYEGKTSTAASKSSASKKDFNESDTMPLNEVLKKIEYLCVDAKDIFRSAPEQTPIKTQLARNLHFKRDGEIFRLRTFLKDSQEGSFKKLVFYKEDDTGFAQIQIIPKEDQINPSKETLRSYLNGGEIIYDERDLRLQFKDLELNFSTINGEIVKIVSPKINCFYDKP